MPQVPTPPPADTETGEDAGSRKTVPSQRPEALEQEALEQSVQFTVAAAASDESDLDASVAADDPSHTEETRTADHQHTGWNREESGAPNVEPTLPMTTDPLALGEQALAAILSQNSPPPSQAIPSAEPERLKTPEQTTPSTRSAICTPTVPVATNLPPGWLIVGGTTLFVLAYWLTQVLSN